MTVLHVWLLVVMSEHGVAMTVANFPSEADCEQARAVAVAKIGAFYKHRSGCVPAKIVKTWGRE
jgi:hypothetical protein